MYHDFRSFKLCQFICLPKLNIFIWINRFSIIWHLPSKTGLGVLAHMALCLSGKLLSQPVDALQSSFKIQLSHFLFPVFHAHPEPKGELNVLSFVKCTVQRLECGLWSYT